MRIFSAFLLALVAGVSSLDARSWGEATAFHLRGAADIVVPVFIGAAGPFRFLLDTGSSRSVVAEGLASRVGAATVAKTAVLTPSGRDDRPVVTIDRLTVGATAAVRVAAMTIPAGQLGAGIDGLIGQDVLGPRTYTIDYRRRVIVWDSRPHDDAGVRLPLEWDDGRVLVSLAQSSSRGDALRMIPDSGADGWVLFARADRALPPMTFHDVAVLRTLAGSRVVRGVVIGRLDVGGIQLRDQRAVLIGNGGDEARFGDGLLPLHVFARVTFNGAARYMVVEAR